MIGEIQKNRLMPVREFSLNTGSIEGSTALKTQELGLGSLHVAYEYCNLDGDRIGHVFDRRQQDIAFLLRSWGPVAIVLTRL